MLPLLAIYAFAGLRLLPAMQQIYNEITMIRFNRMALDSLHEDMAEIRLAQEEALPASEVRVEPVHLPRTLELVDVHYSYPLAERPALRGLSLSIPARTTVGIVGGTGAGKTTAVDLILGLLELQQGRLEADGVPIDRSNLRAWQNTIGYVPQAIFLTDDTVAANIAFGLPADRIDQAAVERAAQDRRAARLRHETSCRRATRPWWASAGCASRAASGSGSASPARSTTTPTC